MDSSRTIALSPEAARARVIIVTGPTATGKTHLAVQLARHHDGEIISADSRQLYRGLDLGTGKDLEEYTCEDGTTIPYHLIDVAEPSVRFDLFKYLDLARQALNDIVARGKMPIICGGTPLYISALLNGYAMIGGEPDQQLRAELEPKPLPDLIAILRSCADAELLARTDLTQSRRVIRAIEIAHHPECTVKAQPLENTLILAPKFTREEVRTRIAQRLDARLKAGMIDEVKALHDDKGITWEQLDWFGLEYRYISRYLHGLLSYDQMYNELLNHIRQFAKRQDIWFRKLEREGHVIHWLEKGQMAGI
jgi:tRNA dimethylallyltransferase